MTFDKKFILLVLIVFTAIYGIGVQPYLDFYLLAFTPVELSGLISFKFLVVYKFLLAFLILATSITTLISKQIQRSFLIFNITYSLTVIIMNASVLLGYDGLNTFYYTDAYTTLRIVQQFAWIAILWMLYKRESVNEN